jgi:hypothetical protein
MLVKITAMRFTTGLLSAVLLWALSSLGTQCRDSALRWHARALQQKRIP